MCEVVADQCDFKFGKIVIKYYAQNIIKKSNTVIRFAYVNYEIIKMT